MGVVVEFNVGATPVQRGAPVSLFAICSESTDGKPMPDKHCNRILGDRATCGEHAGHTLSQLCHTSTMTHMNEITVN